MQAPGHNPGTEAGAQEQIHTCGGAEKLPRLLASFSLLICFPAGPRTSVIGQSPVESLSWGTEVRGLSLHRAAHSKPRSWVAPVDLAHSLPRKYQWGMGWSGWDGEEASGRHGAAVGVSEARWG